MNVREPKTVTGKKPLTTRSSFLDDQNVRGIAAAIGMVALVVACGDPERPGPGPAGNKPPATADAAAPDATMAADGGVSPVDAARLPDGSVQPPDAGAPDAAQLPDGGTPVTPDSGPAQPDGGSAHADAAVPPYDGGTSADAGFDPGPAVLNPGWIGGPCTTVADCNFTDAVCLTAAQGYPAGMCAKPCSRLCPDQQGPLNATTFCIDDGNGDMSGTCFSRCDQTLSPTGCRAGYVCVPEKRWSQPDLVRSTCIPRGGVPGRPAPPFDIGAACAAAPDCNRNTCLTGMPGGYCTQEACDAMGCPTGSRCFKLGLEDYYVCLQDCMSNSDCRAAEGYACDSDQTCWYSPPPRPMCDSTGAAADCAAYASQASMNFVVVTKHKRRLALCNGANLVDTYCVGLGSSPVRDKEREGDRRTPEGVFYIPRLVPNSQYYKAFLLSYPDSADAARGLAAGLITQAEHDAIVAAQNARREPPQHTNLGGLIEIHGRGSQSDWTWGCIAADDSTIDILWPSLGVGDTIVVLH